MSSYLVHTAHLQFAGLWLAVLGWILMAATMGVVQWRVWYVSDVANITSGVAWVGIWRTCFPSRVLVTSERQFLFCQSMGFRDSSTPPEVSLAQVLVPLAVVLCAAGIATALYGLRRVYFGMARRKPLRVTFSVAGALHIAAAICSLLPLGWNMRSVVANRTISFPPNFHMPPAPVRQDVGEGISLGISASILVVASGLMFLSYRLPRTPPSRWTRGPNNSELLHTSPVSPSNKQAVDSRHGRDNLAFELQDNV